MPYKLLPASSHQKSGEPLKKYYVQYFTSTERENRCKGLHQKLRGVLAVLPEWLRPPQPLESDRGRVAEATSATEKQRGRVAEATSTTRKRRGRVAEATSTTRKRPRESG